MAPRHIIVIGASAGGVESLTKLVRHLPGDIPAAVFVTIHFPPTGTSALTRILERVGSLKPAHAADYLPIEEGHIYVAPPDHHLLVFRNQMRLSRGPRENGNRPAVDPMFRSAAVAYGPRVVGVVLTGSLDDGTSGLLAIKRRGGVTVVQDPDDAMFSSMPQSAIDHVDVDYVVKLDRLPSLLEKLATLPLGKGEIVQSDDACTETEYCKLNLSRIEDAEERPSALAERHSDSAGHN